MSSSYKPARADMPMYFMSMLDDRDRNARYSEAIAQCIADFRLEQGRAPRVLDIGVGTGMLSCFCLLHGCEHVTSIDVNPVMIALAGETLRSVDPSGARHTLALVEKGSTSALGSDAAFDMVVSEILGTLTTSESMHKYVSLYSHQLRSFGDERKVYAVPRRTCQYFSLRAFERSQLGGPLSAAIDVAMSTCPETFVPSNEGGLCLNLHLYPSRRIGDAHLLHEERYDRLDDAGAFATRGLSKPVALDVCSLDAADEYPLIVLEWEVELWSRADGSRVLLRNTLDGYAALPLRNALARGSAWGFFVAAVPALASGAARRPLTVRANKLNPARSSTPELTVGGCRVRNVSEEKQPHVPMAADADLAARFAQALREIARDRDRREAEIGGDGGAGCRRVLIINDITCGALPLAAASLGYRVDVVNEDAATAAAGSRAFDAGAARLHASGECGAPPPDSCSWHVGRVSTEREGRRTRGAFVPDESYAPCYDVICFPSALLDAFRGDARRRASADAVAAAWLREGGAVLPRSCLVSERAYAFSYAGLYADALPDTRAQRAGMLGVLGALGMPCVPTEGGEPTATSDPLCFHTLPTVEADVCADADAGADTGAKRQDAVSGALPQECDAPATEAAPDAPVPAPPASASASASASPVTPPKDPKDPKECAGVTESRAILREGDELRDTPPLELCATIPALARLSRSALPTDRRSFAARTMYHGLKLRLRAAGPSRAIPRKARAKRREPTPHLPECGSPAPPAVVQLQEGESGDAPAGLSN